MRWLAVLSLMWTVPAFAQSDEPPAAPVLTAQQTDSLSDFSLRLGLPVVVHGPGYDLGDVMPSFIQTGPGRFYQYGGNQIGWGSAVPSLTHNTGAGGGTGANKGSSPGVGDTIHSNLALAFAPNSIVPIPPAKSSDYCGDWPTSFAKVGPTYYAFVHAEGPCDYSHSQTNESIAMWKSATGAPKSWSAMAVAGVSPGTIISSQEAPEANWLTGFGDGTMLPSADGRWMYAYLSFYCDSAVCDYHNAIARAPMHALGPGNWLMLYHGCFCAPALNNPYDAARKQPKADLFKWVGSSVATMPGTPYTAITVDSKNHAFNIPTQETYNGLAVSIALDYIHFTTLHAPILNYDFQNFNGRPIADDAYLYAILRDGMSGGSVLNSRKMGLWLSYIPPNNDLSHRYIVEYPVTMAPLTRAQRNAGVPQMAISLETYVNSSTTKTYSGHYRTTTVNPLPGVTGEGATESGWAPKSFIGYILTACPSSTTINQCDAKSAHIANRIEECWSGSAKDDYQLRIDTNGTKGSCPSGWVHVRTTGWLYKARQAFGTVPVFACLKASPSSHFSSIDPACNGQTVLGLLGYAAAS